MSKTIKIKKGLTIRLQGTAEKTDALMIRSDKYAIKPTDFRNIFPKLLVSVGDKVKAGTALFYNKHNERVKFTAPVSGTITDIVRGHKRVLEEIVIDAEEEVSHISFDIPDVKNDSKEKIVETLLESGLWPTIIQRPFGIIANPDVDPKAIFISAFDTSPLAPDYDYIVHGKGEIFQKGIDVLCKLTSGKVHINVNENVLASKVFTKSKGVQINNISGIHPAGNVGIQIHHIDPINKGDAVWTINPQAVLTIGKLFTDGIYDASKIISLAGSEVQKPKYYKVIAGTCVDALLNDNIKGDNNRIISGNVLTGTKISKNGYLGYYDSLISVIPEGDYHEFIGWALPGLSKFSTSRTFFSWLTPKKKYVLDTNYHGGNRAFVMTGEYEKVLPMDIYPVQLLKSILIDDIDAMEQLGIYEVIEEDLALCEFVCTSKTEAQDILCKGINMMIKETS